MASKNPYVFSMLHKQILVMLGLSLLPGLGYIFLGWLNDNVLPALVWYSLIILLSLWGYQLFKEFSYASMSRAELLDWHKRLSYFYILIFASWALIFVLYAGESESKMHYIAIFTEIGASVVAAALLFPDKKVLKPILLVLMLPLAIYFALINEFYGYVLMIFSLIFLGVLFYSANTSEKLLRKTHYQASHDQLTGLFNRHAFIDVLQQKVNGLEKESKFSFLLLIDLDHFKTINDTLGHDIGDEILKEVSSRLNQITGKNNTVARLGGDEFVVLGQDFNSEEESLDDAMHISHLLLDSLKATYVINDHHLYLSASIGASQLSNQTLDANVFIKEADIAMYEVKEQGRDGVILFSDELSKRVERHLALEQKLHFALQENEIFLNYQPQVNSEYKIIGCEVLVRWNNKELGFVPPDVFIAIAEQSGFMIELGHYILESAFKTLREWDEKGIELEQFSINISMRQFFHHKFIEDIEYLCQMYLNKKLRKKIVFEMTETLHAEDVVRLVTIMNSLADIDIRFSMDDFGTGYSSLSYIRQMPIYELKIDRSFINVLGQHTDTTKMVNTIINLAKTFHLTVVGEGVETEEQAHFLVEQGCDILQGYLFAKPLSKEKFEENYFQPRHLSQKPNVIFHI
ncbi:putative bifunctional diguanylate cyclase/phosphodiesterase [Campylobacterota bacterium]